MSDSVYILAIGMTRFGKYPDLGVKQLVAQEISSLVEDSPVEMKDIEAAWFSNSGWGMSMGQHSIRGQVALTPLGIHGIPILNVENACAGGSSAVNSAWASIKAGLYDIVLAIGVEKTYYPEHMEKVFEGFLSGVDVEFGTAMVETLRAQAVEKKTPGAGETGRKAHSAFMDIYAMLARRHMEKFGTTQRQLAVITSKNHHHGSMNPLAQYQREMTVEEVLDDVLVSYPITRSMCAPIGDGAAAALICSERAARRFREAKPIRISASVMGSGSLPHSGLKEVGVRAAATAYERAGVGPGDIDVAELHDATAFGELAQYEQMGFCGRGEGGPFAESGATALGGRLPVNTSGGLECRGHPVGASGIAQLHELVTQLRGKAGARQVEGARVALAENGGGFIGTGEAALCVHILEK